MRGTMVSVNLAKASVLGSQRQKKQSLITETMATKEINHLILRPGKDPRLLSSIRQLQRKAAKPKKITQLALDHTRLQKVLDKMLRESALASQRQKKQSLITETMVIKVRNLTLRPGKDPRLLSSIRQFQRKAAKSEKVTRLALERIRIRKSLDRMSKESDLANLGKRRPSLITETMAILRRKNLPKLDTSHLLRPSVRQVPGLSRLRIRAKVLVLVNIKLTKSLDRMSKAQDLVNLSQKRKLSTIGITTIHQRENLLRLDTSHLPLL